MSGISCMTELHLASFRLPLLLFYPILVFGMPPAWAQEFPSRPIRIIVPNLPGVAQDILIRLVAPGMSKSIGQPVVVENKAGADGVIAYEYVAKLVPADGFVLIIGSTSQLAILPLIMKDMHFNPLKDLVPVIGISKARYVFASSAKLPFKTFGEVVSYAKSNPGKLNYGSSGATTRFVTETISRSVAMTLTLIPYKGGAAYQQAMVQNEVQVGLLTESAAIMQGDRVKALAATGEPRLAAFPNTPTFAELGYPKIPGTSYDLSVASATPKPVINKLYTSVLQAIQEPELKARLAKVGLDAVGESPEDGAQRLADEGRLFAEIAKAIGIKPE